MNIKKKQVVSWEAALGVKRQLDVLAVEEPLEIRVDTRPISVTMRTPGHDEELAAGFLLSEGLIFGREDVVKIRHWSRNREGNVIDVFLGPGVEVDFAQLTRQVFASSSCGLCGKSTLMAVQRRFRPVRCKAVVAGKVMSGLPGRLLRRQEGFARTGGLHGAALFDLEGRLVLAREDVGRHNAVDKVLGHGLLQGLPPFDRHILMVSGRVSFEIMQKALAGRVPIVAAVSAPSSLAVEFARRSKQTLVGFLREGRMNIYAGEDRIRF